MKTSTLQVEYSGFYPPEFEAPLWKKSFDDPEYEDIDSDKVESLIHFLIDTEK